MPRTSSPTELSPLLERLLVEAEQSTLDDYESPDEQALALARVMARRLHERLPKEPATRLALYAAGVWLNR